MFYIIDVQRPHFEVALGTAEFERIIYRYVIDISELTVAQYETFKGALFAFDLLKELIPDDTSKFVVRFYPDE